MNRTIRCMFFVFVSVFFIVSQTAAQETESFSDNISNEGVSAYTGGLGLSAGTPGIIHMDFIMTSREHAAVDPGIMISYSLLFPLLARDDYDDETDTYNEKTEGDTIFLSAQAGIPFFLAKTDDMFLAFTPLAGGGYYEIYHEEESNDTGWWYYGGAAFDFRYKSFFAEAGLAYGPSKDYYTIAINDKLSVLCRAGIILWFN